MNKKVVCQEKWDERLVTKCAHPFLKAYPLSDALRMMHENVHQPGVDVVIGLSQAVFEEHSIVGQLI